MATLTTYRVLIDGELTARLPLAGEAEGNDGSEQEMCGWGYEGDFRGGDENGRHGQVWEFVTFSPTAMEQALDTDAAVIVYSSRPGTLEG